MSNLINKFREIIEKKDYWCVLIKEPTNPGVKFIIDKYIGDTYSLFINGVEIYYNRQSWDIDRDVLTINKELKKGDLIALMPSYYGPYLENFYNQFYAEIITNTEDIQQFRCYNKNGSGCYRFEAIFTGYAIYVSGDMGELTITPGYGRGIKWFRGSVNSPSYFYKKISRDMNRLDCEHLYIPRILKGYLYDSEEEDDLEHNRKLLEVIEKIEKYDHSLDEIYEILYNDLEWDELPELKIASNHIKHIYAGLLWLNEALDTMEFEVGCMNVI